MEDLLRLAFQVFTRRLRRLRWLVLWPLRACRRGRLSRLLPSCLRVSPPTVLAHLLVCCRPGFALLWLDLVLLGPAAAACCARLRFLGVYRAKLVSWSVRACCQHLRQEYPQAGQAVSSTAGKAASSCDPVSAASCNPFSSPARRYRSARPDLAFRPWVNSGLLSRSCAWSA